MNEDKRRKEAFKWQKEQTTQYNLRFLNATGIPEALQKATRETGETTPEYIKNSIIRRLKSDGFLQDKTIVLNLNKQRHKEKIERLEKYIEEEKKKIK